MNIFVLDADYRKAAKAMCDKHVPKMVLETAQLLSTANIVFGRPAPYKLTHKNHPCAVWTREARENYQWLWLYGCALADEYTYRFGKVHKSEAVIESLRQSPVPAAEDFGGTPFAQCMPDQYRGPDPVEAYRRFYKAEKAYFAKWERGRRAPDWWLDSRG